MLKKTPYAKVIFWLILLLVLFIRGTIFLDPDFGWRLRSGEIILKEGIPRTDLFTYSMPSYPWVNHAWGTDVIIAFLYPLIGAVGLSILFSIITLLAIYITYTLVFKISSNLRNKKSQIDRWYLSAPVLVLTGASFLRFFGIRAQVWTWLFMAIIFKLVLDQDVWKKWRFILPLLFLFWGNIHGGFAAGLLTLLLVISVKTIQTKKVDFSDLFVLFSSILCTFVNPYGTEIYREVWYTIIDSENHKNILEWNNYFKSFNLPSLFLLVFSFIMVFRMRKSFKFIELGLYIAFLYQALTSVRQVPLWAIVAFYSSYRGILEFFRSLKDKLAESRFVAVYKIFYILSFIVFLIEVFSAYMGSVYYSEKNFYPTKAVVFVKENISDGEIFSKYDYGGYLIWKLPEKKVYIDGRMPFWRGNENRVGEATSAMREYMDLLGGKTNYRQLFEKHNVKLVLWSNPKKAANFKNIENRLSDQFGFLYRLLGIEKQEFSLIQDLEKDKWEKIYEDNISVVYKKPQQLQ